MLCPDDHVAEPRPGGDVDLDAVELDVREVTTNFECGVQVEGFDSFEVGDVVETYRIERET